ncbi:MAG: hypothetical protein QME51_03585 [Planctomycetota bacterium]|nr:hypothetical protein [Planctomycetota bacterium]
MFRTRCSLVTIVAMVTVTFVTDVISLFGRRVVRGKICRMKFL